VVALRRLHFGGCCKETIENFLPEAALKGWPSEATLVILPKEGWEPP
jgi:hypothetical protein